MLHEVNMEELANRRLREDRQWRDGESRKSRWINIASIAVSFVGTLLGVWVGYQLQKDQPKTEPPTVNNNIILPDSKNEKK